MNINNNIYYNLKKSLSVAYKFNKKNYYLFFNIYI